MINKKSRNAIREKKHLKIRNRFSGTPERPRLAVFRSNQHIYAQVIDDEARRTLVSASTVEKAIAAEVEHTDTVEAAAKVGEMIGKRALEAGVTEVVFDRGGFVYHGKIQALADAAREAGLTF